MVELRQCVVERRGGRVGLQCGGDVVALRAFRGQFNDHIVADRQGVLTGADREQAGVSMLRPTSCSQAWYSLVPAPKAVLRDPQRAGKLTGEGRRGLSPLFWSHVNPYGRFRLDMDTRLDLTAA